MEDNGKRDDTDKEVVLTVVSKAELREKRDSREGLGWCDGGVGGEKILLCTRENEEDDEYDECENDACLSIVKYWRFLSSNAIIVPPPVPQ